MCLNTVETVFRDTVINVTLIGGSAGAEGDVIQCMCMLILYKRNVMYQFYMSVHACTKKFTDMLKERVCRLYMKIAN